MDVKTTVVVADDHSLVRRGTREILDADPGIMVVGEAATGAELLDLVSKHQPDVALVDIGMPGMGGLEALARIRADHPGVVVIMLTIEDDIEYVWSAIEAGASGFLTKDVDDTALIEAVKAAARGGSVLSPGLTRKVLEHLRSGSDRLEPAPDLTPRELEVLTEAARGLSNKEIAQRLGLSARTVEVHLTHAFRKIGATSRTQAVMIAVRQGWIAVADG